jgi:hypothetical protein
MSPDKARSFSTDRLAHGAAELTGVISLHSQNFRDGAYIFHVQNFDFKRLRFDFLAHVCDELGNPHPCLTASVFFKLPLAIQEFAECGRRDVDAYPFGAGIMPR